MKTNTIAAGLALLGAAVAQRPTNTSICDYYTAALLTDNNATNQYTLLTLLVNTAVIGNYTQPNKNAVAGILAPGTYNGTAVDLLPYFDGGLDSSNRGGSEGVSVNFLDDGGAAPLKMNKPSNGTTSNQYKLLTHLYEFFGVLLGCTEVGMTGFPAYAGDSSMYQVHRFMALDAYQLGWFVEQVALSAASFGVAADDIEVVVTALGNLFGMKCAPPTTVVKAQGAELQAICIESDCPTSPNATCAAYSAVTTPAKATSTGTATMSATGTSTSGPAKSTSKSASIALRLDAAIGVLCVGVAALLAL